MEREYRVTRPQKYKHNCRGNLLLLERTGHYVSAETFEQAATKIRKRLNLPACELLDVQLWPGGAFIGTC